MLCKLGLTSVDEFNILVVHSDGPSVPSTSGGARCPQAPSVRQERHTTDPDGDVSMVPHAPPIQDLDEDVDMLALPPARPAQDVSTSSHAARPLPPAHQRTTERLQQSISKLSPLSKPAMQYSTTYTPTFHSLRATLKELAAFVGKNSIQDGYAAISGPWAQISWMHCR